jgi:hypothetical protein
MRDIPSNLVANFLGRDDGDFGNHFLVLFKVCGKMFSVMFEDCITESLDLGFPRFAHDS